jgi:hypothetical protein
MTITALPSRNEYTATAGQTLFSYTFKIFESTDLNVYVTPAGQDADDVTDIVTGYSVTGLGDEDGGTITLVAAASIGDLVTIVSDIPENRTTDYQDNGDFLPDTVNADFDRVVSLTKQIDEKVNRSLISKESQQGSKPLTLPEPSSLQFLRWRSDLQGMENVDLTSFGDPTDSSVINYNEGSTGSINRTVEAKLQEMVSVADFGAFGDGATDYSTEIQAALDSGASAVFFSAGEYRAVGLNFNDNQKLYAGALGRVTIKNLDNSSTPIIRNADQVTTERVNVCLENITFDGNKANSDQSTNAASAVTCSGVIGFRVVNCIFQNASGYGLALQAFAGSSIPTSQRDIYIENCEFNTNGDGTSFAPGTTFDGFDVKDCKGLTMIGCSATGNADKGIDVRGDNVYISGGYSKENIKGYGFSGNAAGENLATNITATGISAYSNTGDGIELGSGTVTPSGKVRVNLVGIHSYSNALRGVNMPAESEDMQVSIVSANIHHNTSHGFQALENTDSVVISNSSIKSNGGNGISTEIEGMKIDNCDIQLNTLDGVKEQTNGSGTMISDSTIINNSDDDVSINPTTKTMQVSNSFDLAPGNNDVASSTTLQISVLNETFNVTGTNNISNLANERESRVVRLKFAGILDVIHGSGIRLPGGSNITTTVNAVLILESDGTDWYQSSYSANI